ncbi:hypothetical protein VTK26DRAFT_222 [Humicola hyalothermophila]
MSLMAGNGCGGSSFPVDAALSSVPVLPTLGPVKLSLCHDRRQHRPSTVSRHSRRQISASRLGNGKGRSAKAWDIGFLIGAARGPYQLCHSFLPPSWPARSSYVAVRMDCPDVIRTWHVSQCVGRTQTCIPYSYGAPTAV